MDSTLLWLVLLVVPGVIAGIYLVYRCLKYLKKKKNGHASERKKVPHGLRNQGATCYLNSVLQVLFWTPEIHQALDRIRDRTNHTDKALKELFDQLKEGESGTANITNHLQIDNVCEQRDAAVYLELLLNRMSAEVSEPFRGELKYKTECSKGHCIIEEPYPFWTLPLPLCSSVTEGLHTILKCKNLSLYCGQCEKETEVKRDCKMTKLPQILVLLLKKSDINRTGSFPNSYCEEEASLNIKTHPDVTSDLCVQAHTYSLCGVVDHRGGLWGGHYTATIQSHKDRNWYQFSDTSVCEAEEQKGKKSNSAYLLIYRDNSSSNYF